MDKIDRGFFSEFESFLMVQKGLNENTANKVAKHFDRFLCYAYERDWILEKPRFKVTLKYRNPQRIILTLDEIRQLEVQPLSNMDLDELRDCAIFQCYTGLAYSEIKALNKHHIKDIFGKKWIVMNRKKTGSEVKLVILPKALAILNKYENNSYCNENDQLLPIRSNCRYNVKLKEIQRQCGFNTKLNSHLFRHTFSSTVALSLGLPMETLSKCLGHQNLATTAIYGKILNNRIFDDFEKLEARLAVTL
jgi:site-specific recombinase XerD